MSLFETLESWDQELFLFLNGLHNEPMDHFMAVVTNKWAFVPVYLIVLILLIQKYGWKQLIIILPAVAVLILLTDQISYNGLKETVQRLRPCHNFDFGHLVHVVTKCGGKHGFVSGHSANSFGIALFAGVLLQNQRWKWGLLAWAALVAYSRIYVGVHYPADIVGGALLGIGCALLVLKAYRFADQRNNLTASS